MFFRIAVNDAGNGRNRSLHHFNLPLANLQRRPLQNPPAFEHAEPSGSQSISILPA